MFIACRRRRLRIGLLSLRDKAIHFGLIPDDLARDGAGGQHQHHDRQPSDHLAVHRLSHECLHVTGVGSVELIERVKLLETVTDRVPQLGLL